MNSYENIQKAADLLRSGKLVAFPTETVYGLGGNALSDHAIAGIYATKQRPQFNPLIVHVASPDAAKHYVEWTATADVLAKHFWPGPLTLVLKRKADSPLSLLVSAGLDCVAVRSPDHPIAQALLASAGLPVAAPSANRSGRISPTEAAHVEEELGDRIGMILDGGSCSIGLESTVVDLTKEQPVVLRPGSVTLDDLARFIPGIALVPKASYIISPGMLESHYAPSCQVRLNARNVMPGEGVLAFGPHPLPGAEFTENLSVTGSLTEAAANLFRMLRKLDNGTIHSIAAMPIPEMGLGIAINDRLRRAAAPRKAEG